jgi:hypothetical protein
MGHKKFYLLHDGCICDQSNNIEKCKAIGMKYVQRVINYLNERLFNLFMFNACILFIPILYPTYPNDKTCSIEQWLNRLCGKFQVPNDECDKYQMNVLKWLKPCGRQYPRSFYGWHGTM